MAAQLIASAPALAESSTGYVRHIDMSNVEKNDFECTLCYRFLYQPVTTPCGHSFCRTCLDRCLDHSTNCPLCKTSIKVVSREEAITVTDTHHAFTPIPPLLLTLPHSPEMMIMMYT